MRRCKRNANFAPGGKAVQLQRFAGLWSLQVKASHPFCGGKKWLGRQVLPG